MIEITLQSEHDFTEWKRQARQLINREIPPSDIFWRKPGDVASLFSGPVMSAPLEQNPVSDGRYDRAIRVPRSFADAAARVICHRDESRHARLYRLLWRLQQHRGLMASRLDDDVEWLRSSDKNIHRDLHKMHAFVRFRKVGEEAGREAFAAWFEPDHHIGKLAAPFFVKRFYGMDWAIIMPAERIIWQNEQLDFAAGGSRDDVPDADGIEDQWRTYFRAIFNPARVKVAAMQSEMPKKYWKNLPESECIKPLLAGAEERVQHMRDKGVTGDNPQTDKWRTVPERDAQMDNICSREDLTIAINRCQRCSLHQTATQAVHGEGPADARLMVVGEQPGDQEDLQGRPFIGPAGQLLDKGFAAAGIDRGAIYLTNAVKHFKYKPQGKRRLHQNPSAHEIDHCRWWLDKERALVKPKVIVALGGSAIRGIIGKSRSVSDMRGRVVTLEDKSLLIATYHPSYLLRLPNDQKRADIWQSFVSDLKLAHDSKAASLATDAHNGC